MSLHFLIVGFGSIGQRHLAILRELVPDATITLLRRPTSVNADTHPDGVDRVTHDINVALEKEITAAFICSPAPFHLETAMLLAETNTHLFIEKPLATSTQYLKQFLGLCQEKKLVVGVGYNLRFLKSLQRLKFELAQQTYGQVYTVQASVGQFLPTWRNSDYRDSVSAQKHLGGGVMLELSHEIDYLTWMFGTPSTFTATFGRHSSLAIDVEDTANFWFTFDMTSGQHFVANLHLDFLDHATHRFCRVVCEQATLLWDGIGGSLKVFAQGDDSWQTLVPEAQDRGVTYREQAREFLDHIQHGEKAERVMCTIEEAASTIDLIEQAQSRVKQWLEPREVLS